MAQPRTGIKSKVVRALTVWIAFCLIAGSATASYWTVPINYYELEHVRFALAQDSYGAPGAIEPIQNLAQMWKGVPYDGLAVRVQSAYDPERGYSAQFSAKSAAYISYHVQTVSQINNRDAASLSFWFQPQDGAENSMVLSSGNSLVGYSLYLLNSQLVFVYWNHTDNRPQIYGVVEGKTKLVQGAWHNVILTQTSAKIAAGTYAALYVDGVLDGSSTRSPDGSGLLGRSTYERSRSNIGSAVQAGWIHNRKDEPYRYRRSYDDRTVIAGLNPFTTGKISEFRYFGGTELVCSDKTSANYRQLNRNLAIGFRCDSASDVASLAHDRLEQAGFLARLPYAYDLGDHNFQGLSNPNAPSGCTGCSLPVFQPDEVRHAKATFRSNRVQYQADVGSLSMAKVGWPFGVSFWFYSSSEHYYQPIFTAGSAKGSGINIALSGGDGRGQIQALAWENGGKPRGATSAKFGSGWHHVAVSFDGASMVRDEPVGRSQLKIFIDGVSQSDGPLGARPAAARAGPVTIGGPDALNGTLDLDGRIHTDATFEGGLSEIQVTGMPITFAQARSLASRLPNAYMPNYAREYFAHYFENAQGFKQQTGYSYRDIVSQADNGHSLPRYTYDSADLKFEVDWSRTTPRWIDEGTGQMTDDCEYVVGGLKSYGANPREWPLEQPSSVLLCFSPKKISRKLPAFSLGLYYPSYGKFLFVTVVEPLAEPSVLQSLKDYSFSRAVPGYKTRFALNIGRYNMLVQAQSDTPSGRRVPNFLSALYLGADDLVSRVFAYNGANPPPSQRVTFIRPEEAVNGVDLKYVDQKQLLNDVDMKFSKDR